MYECYGRWWKLQCRLNDFYAEKERQRPPLSQQKEFRQIKNAVLQVAEQVRQNEITFEDAGAEPDAEQNATCNVPYPANAWHAMATTKPCRWRIAMKPQSSWKRWQTAAIGTRNI
ncbi:MAG: hypothetical protein ACLRSV_03540 [Oscillospiraceae bacterium]